MATIKSYTDLSQSKKLEEILSVESADMCYLREDGKAKTMSPSEISEILNVSKPQVIPCWSLTALLDLIPQVELDSIKQYDKKYWRCCAYFASDWHHSDWCDNPVDACYEMILKLHELKR